MQLLIDQLFDNMFKDENWESILTLNNLKEKIKSDSIKDSVIEWPTCFMISIEVPGTTKENIDITVKNGYINVDIKKEKPDYKDGKVISESRIFGTYSKAYKLGKDADANNISAKFVNGILKIKVEKVKESEPKSEKVTIE